RSPAERGGPRRLLGVGVAVHDRYLHGEHDGGGAEQQPPRLVRGGPDGVGDVPGPVGGRVHDDLVVLEEHQPRAVQGDEAAAQGGEQGERPVGGGGLDDEVAGEAAPAAQRLRGRAAALGGGVVARG